MGQRARILAEILRFRGWIVQEAFFEDSSGARVAVTSLSASSAQRLVLVLKRRWMPRCGTCTSRCDVLHERLLPRRWADLPWGPYPVQLQYSPARVKCRHCRGAPVELVAWADPRQRQTRRLQQQLAVLASSMPVTHVAAMHRLTWGTVRRAEQRALQRWDATRTPRPLRHVGVDEKFLGRRNRLAQKFVTIVSNLDTGEPVWIGYGRTADVLRSWIDSLSEQQKSQIQLFAMDMWPPFEAAVRDVPGLEHVAIVHDPFHVMKRAIIALEELRKDVFFRASPELRRIGGGHGRRWLLLRAWERTSAPQRAELRRLFSYNATLARGYQLKEELRAVLAAPSAAAMKVGLDRILRRTQRRDVPALRRLHQTLRKNYDQILALGEHRPRTGRIEALNNNWEALVRRGRGYRDHRYLVLKLRFATANPIRGRTGLSRFLALAEAA